jgi:hypothetical protein
MVSSIDSPRRGFAIAEVTINEDFEAGHIPTGGVEYRSI